jgi:hypothetical protein
LLLSLAPQTNRPEWIEFLNTSGLQEIGNDPKRHTPETRAKFWASVKGGAAKPAKTAAPESSDDDGSSDDDNDDSSSSSDSSDDEADKPAPAAAPKKAAAASSSDDDSSSDSDGDDSSSDSSSDDDETPAPATAAAAVSTDAALAEIKSNRAAWVDWLAANGLSDVGNDPKRHSAETQQKFYASVKGGGAPVVKKAAAPVVESSDSDDEDSSDSDDSDSDDSDSDEQPASKIAVSAPTIAAPSPWASVGGSAPTTATAAASPEAALAEVRSNRKAWVDWLVANGLSDVGNDPKRHSAATLQKFYASVKGGGAPVVKKAAVESSDDSSSDDESSSDDDGDGDGSDSDSSDSDDADESSSDDDSSSSAAPPPVSKSKPKTKPAAVASIEEDDEIAKLKAENERLKREAMMAALREENEQLKRAIEKPKVEKPKVVATADTDDSDSDSDSDSSDDEVEKPKAVAAADTDDSDSDSSDDDDGSSSAESDEESGSSSSSSSSSKEAVKPAAKTPAPSSKSSPPPAGEPDEDGLLAFIKSKRPMFVKYLRDNNLADVGNDPKRHTEATRRGFWRAQQPGAATTSAAPIKASNKRAAEPAPAPAAKKAKPAPENLPPKEFDGVGIDVSACSTAAELLQAHGADALKAELQRLGLKCGGKPIERAERLLASGGRTSEELNGSFLLANAPATKAVLVSDKVRRRNEIQNKKREREALGKSAKPQQTKNQDDGSSDDDSSDDGDDSSDGDSSDEGEDNQKAAAPAAKAAAPTRVSDAEVLEVCKTNREAWMRWLKKHNLEKTGRDPTRHTPATRRKFFRDPNAKKKMPGQPAKAAQPAKATKPAPAAVAKPKPPTPVSPAGAPRVRSSKMSVVLARAREAGVEQGKLDAAMDASDPRQAVVRAALNDSFPHPTYRQHYCFALLLHAWAPYDEA